MDLLKVDVEGSELEALCSASALFERGQVEWLGFELNPSATSKAASLTIRQLLRHYGMVHRHVEGLPAWSWDRDLGSLFRKGFMVMYQRDDAAGGVHGRRDDEKLSKLCVAEVRSDE